MQIKSFFKKVKVILKITKKPTPNPINKEPKQKNMIKKLRRRITRITTQIIKQTLKTKPPKPKPPFPSPPPPPMPPPPPPTTTPYLFPISTSTVLPNPTPFFSPSLLPSPLPTNSFFQNLSLKNGDQPEYIHPYLIKSTSNSLSISYPSIQSTPNFLYQIPTPDLSISTLQSQSNGPQTHTISSFDDLSLTLDIPPSLRFYLTRGSPYVTLSTQSTKLSISTVHAVLNHQSNDAQTKHKLLLNNGQTWLCYASSPLRLSSPNVSSLESQDGFAGTVRFAALPSSDGDCERVLDRFGSCYPVSGEAVFHRTFCVEYKWETRGWSGGDLLMLAHPLHLKMLCASDGRDLTVIDGFRYESIDGPLVGVVGDNWVLKTDPLSVTWHSYRGIREEAFDEISSALVNDVKTLAPITTSSSYFYGKAIARAARLALIAEEVRKPELIPAVHHFLRDSITPWLDGSFPSNGFLYDPKWGGLVTKAGLSDSGADFGFGIYNDHHYHLGYFVYAIAVLVKLDPAWARAYRPQCYALVADFMSLGRRSTYTKLRCFDAWKLHSWAGGLTEFADGRNQESTSEAVNAYYSAALMGLAFGDAHLASVGATLAAFEIEAARMWWHVREGERGMYTEGFVAGNRVVGVLWANKRDAGLWFAPPEWRECRLGIQLLPLAPITEALFADVGFARELVKWAMLALDREGVGEGWKGFVYALEGVYDKEAALEKVRRLNGYDDGNSLSNLLWWLHSREDGEGGGGSLFGQYCH